MNDQQIAIESYLEQAASGDREAARAFFQSFLDEQVAVPERRQAQPLSDQPTYPNEFVNFLGIQEKDRVIVPVFSREELVENWCGNKLRCRSLTGAELLKRLPDDWWITFNPGSESGKEFSPWEVEQLREGTAGIDPVIEENFSDSTSPHFEISVPPVSEYEPLREELRKVATQEEAISRLFLLKKQQTDSEETDNASTCTLLVGVELTQQVSSQVKQDIQSATQRTLMGAEPFEVYFGGSSGDRSDMEFGIFRVTEPFFSRSGSYENLANTTVNSLNLLKRLRNLLWKR